jgi:hypothetical protein
MTPDELRRMTQDYWLDAECLEYPDAVRRYIRDLLPHELAYARGHDAIPSCPQRCDWLALLVGYSWEPLLQAVCVYRPENILLVLNEHYGDTSGVALGRELADIIRALPQELFSAGGEVQIHPDPPEFAGERPAQIFRFLRDRFLPRLREAEQPRIVLDITGAKKSMVAGAYLFGAHANVDVSYVDFDEYDSRRSRPYGYSCRIGLLANPYEAFRLRDWQRVGQLYEQYAFGAARALLGDILASAGQAGGERLRRPAVHTRRAAGRAAS